ncbi:hypothetical protein [Ilumatobacter coccineus]|nr:hypothetical protein [Ilumatobacter coccineus]
MEYGKAVFRGGDVALDVGGRQPATTTAPIDAMELITAALKAASAAGGAVESAAKARTATSSEAAPEAAKHGVPNNVR